MPPDLPHLLKNAEAASEAGDHETALRLCAAAVEQYPMRYEGYEARGEILYRLGRLSEAFADLEQVMRLAPDTAAPYFRRGCWKLAADENDLIL